MSAREPLRHRERPAAREPEGALVLLHGRGADENDLFPLLDYLDPEQRLVAATPRAPHALPPGGAHWYVLGALGYPDPPTFLASARLLGDWLDAFAERTGIPPERTILGGFSQGAAMTYGLGLAHGRTRPAALLALSGFMPTVPGWPLDVQTSPPVAIGHGTYDAVIGVEWGRRAKETLEAAGVEVVYRESPLPHAIDPAFLDDLRPWLAEAVSVRA